uniref:Aminopeptidase P N-terminal domain-containing protein n=2 Tax=Arcella intermedia TaxID=1963864 RepID=A0A6B2L4M3_9EUKA
MQVLTDKDVVIMPAARFSYMTNDIPYRYRQNTNFLYLSGFHEPSSVLVLEKRNGNPYFLLFVKPRDPHTELWHGPMTGVERVGEFGADEGLPLSQLSNYLNALPKSKTIYYSNILTDDDISDNIQQFLASGRSVQDATPFVDYMRVVKSEAEVNVMRKSVSISAVAFKEVMKSTKHCKTEAQLEAIMEYHCRMLGAERLAYPPVVSNGITNNTMHYINNDNILRDGNLILMDAGGEFNNFASDITRSWPVNGKFTEAQKDVYNEVLNVLHLCTAAVKADGQTNLNTLHAYSTQLVEQALKRLKLPISGESSVRRYYPHTIGHWLGMDVHDVGTVSNELKLMPGMFVTVEPGLYIPDEPDIPPELRGIGIRIEDDVLVTKGNPYIFTKDVPKEVKDLEAICAS